MMENAAERGPVSFPPPLVYIAGLLLGWFAERLAPTPALPRGLAWAAAAIGVAGFVALDFRSAALFMKKKTGIAPWTPATTLVTEGPYRFTRNPMYLGMALLYLGLALAFGLLWAVALLPFVVGVVDRGVIAREEAYLEAKYGVSYDEYRRRVRRWI